MSELAEAVSIMGCRNTIIVVVSNQFKLESQEEHKQWISSEEQ